MIVEVGYGQESSVREPSPRKRRFAIDAFLPDLAGIPRVVVLSTMASNATCLFCRIAAGEIPAKKLHEDDDVIAFHDINPQAPTHVLVIPRKHIPSLDDLTDADAATIGTTIVRASEIARRAQPPADGYRLVVEQRRRRRPDRLPHPRPPPRRTPLHLAAGIGYAQFSTRNPATRRNSRSLFETSVRPRATACAAMIASSGPIGVPASLSLARTRA